jgi:hypothetical protein
MSSNNERESGDVYNHYQHDHNDQHQHHHGEPRSSSRAKLQTLAGDDEMKYESCADLEEVKESEQQITEHPKTSYI